MEGKSENKRKESSGAWESRERSRSLGPLTWDRQGGQSLLKCVMKQTFFLSFFLSFYTRVIGDVQRI